MNQYVTGTMIKKLREEKRMTQVELAQKICVSEKTISKWETSKGYPDISILEDLAKSLDISVIELLSGNDVTNRNRAGNVRKIKIYVCPICGNVMIATGEAVVSCCGVVLLPLEAEKAEENHELVIQRIEDEYYVSLSHEMSKMHYISFMIAVKDNATELIKLYPEGGAECRFKVSRTKEIYYYCNRHGLFCVMV